MYPETIEVGQIVQLKCGGPKMIISSLSRDETFGIQCNWFNEELAYCSGWFRYETLKAAE